MRRIALIALLLAALFVHEASSDSCFKSAGKDVKLAENCKSGNVTLLLKEDELNLSIDRVGDEKINSSLGLKLGSCDVGGDLFTASGVSSLIFGSEVILKFPVKATVNKDGARFVGTSKGTKSPPSHLVGCSPVFKKVNEGFIIEAKYAPDEVISDLSLIFKNAVEYSSTASEGTWKIPVIILGVLIGVLAFSIVAGFFCYRWNKARRLKHVEEEAALKKPAAQKPVEKKPALETPKPAGKPTEKSAEAPEPIAKKKEMTKPEKPKQALKASKAPEAPKVQEISEGLRTAKDGPFKKQQAKKSESDGSTLKTSEFPTKHAERVDILEMTARDETATKATTGGTTGQTTETTTEATLEVLSSKMPGEFNHFLRGKKYVKELLDLVGPQQRHQIYFKDISVDVYDACNDILKEICVAVESGASKEQEVSKFREKISSLKDLAKEVYRFTVNGKGKSRLPWSFMTALDLGYLTDQQIEEGFNLEEPTTLQIKRLTIDLQDLRKQYREMPSGDPAEAKMGALIKQVERLEGICRKHLRNLEWPDAEIVQQ